MTVTGQSIAKERKMLAGFKMIAKVVCTLALVTAASCGPVAAKSLADCKGLDGAACAEALYKAEAGEWQTLCRETISDEISAEACLNEMKKCLPYDARKLEEISEVDVQVEDCLEVGPEE